MRKLLAVLLLAPLVFAQEIRRPTTDFNSGAAAWAVNYCGAATAATPPVGTLAYDAAGQATSINYILPGTRYVPQMYSRTFSNWLASTTTYSSLTLNVNASSLGFTAQGTGDATSCVAYSRDGGTVWTSLNCDSGPGWTQQTFTVILSATQDLSKLRVGICVWADSGGGITSNVGRDNIQVYDIWTTGNTSASTTTGSNTSGQPHRGLVIVH